MQSVGQLIIMGVPGPELNEGLRKMIQRIQPGGFILFARNLASAQQTFDLVAELHSLCHHRPMITIDQEGGRVSRLNMFAQEPPSAQELQCFGDVSLCEKQGELNGRLLAMLGFNLNLAPVLDYNPFDERDNSLGGRCWGTNPSETIEKASAFLRGMQKHGVKGTGKHFPGYTFCEKDPHGDLPIIRRTEQQIQEEELAVFRAFVPLAEAMMIGHAHFPAWHEEPFPASLSPRIVQTMLREQMGYQGLIMTDDLEMGAIANRFGMEETTRLAIEAGEDALLICHNPACVEIAFDTLNSMPVEKVQRAMNSVSSFCQSLLAPPQSFNLDAFNQVNAEMKELRERVRR